MSQNSDPFNFFAVLEEGAKRLQKDKQKIDELSNQLLGLFVKKIQQEPKDRIKQVREFCVAFNQTVNDTPTIPEDWVGELRKKLTKEECVTELHEGIDEKNLLKILDALCDSLYVIYGTAVAYGLDSVLDAAFNEVHESNMTKLGPDGKPIYNEFGKVTKGPNYRPPDLRKFVTNKDDLA